MRFSARGRQKEVSWHESCSRFSTHTEAVTAAPGLIWMMRFSDSFLVRALQLNRAWTPGFSPQNVESECAFAESGAPPAGAGIPNLNVGWKYCSSLEPQSCKSAR